MIKIMFLGFAASALKTHRARRFNEFSVGDAPKTLLRILFILAVVQSALIGFALAEPAYVPGTIMWVIDGDTYRIRYEGAPNGETVRARHFDTAEKGDLAACVEEKEKARQGTEAARRLLPKGSVVLLSDFGWDRYGRQLATVTLSDGRDLASVMIEAGLAVPYEGGKKASWCQPFRRRRHDGLKTKGPSAPRASTGKRRPQAVVVRGRSAPKIRKRIAQARLRFWALPRRPLPHDFATPDFTTGKRFAAQKAKPSWNRSEDLS